MIVDFSKIDLGQRQILVLQNLDGTPIQPLLHYSNGKAKLNFNEISELSFSVSSIENGSPTAGYESIVGMRVIDWVNVGRFSLVEPETVNNGIVEIKNCTAYSLEYELSYKTFAIAKDGAYSLTQIFDKIFEGAPSWSLGDADLDVMNTSRYFTAETFNVYDFLKNKAQETFRCVFDFDTYARKIHVISADKVIAQQPVLITTQNLAKEIKVKEQTEEVFTVFNVTGAEGVDIRGVNPSGNNVLHNLDYFMNTEYFTQDIIDRWNRWKEICASYREPYYLLSINQMLQTNRKTTEEAALILMKEELENLSVMMSASSSSLAAAPNDELLKSEYQKDKDAHDAKAKEISAQEQLINDIDTTLKALVEEQSEINKKCALPTYFSDEEMLLFDKYFRATDLSDDTFVYKEVASYSDKDMTHTSVAPILTFLTDENTPFTMTVLKDSSGEKSILTGSSGLFDSYIRTFSDDGSSSDIVVSGTITNFVIQDNHDGSAIACIDLGEGTYGTEKFQNATLTAIFREHFNGIQGSFVEDEELGDGHFTGLWALAMPELIACTVCDGAGMIDGTECPRCHGEVRVTASSGTVHFTRALTEYSKRMVEWDLLQYAEKEIQKAAWPKYQFSVDSSNFLTAKDFIAFKNQFKLGARNYVQVDKGILTPIAISAEVDFTHLESLNLKFGDEYSSFDSSFQMVDILGEAVTSIKSWQKSKSAASSFVNSGAQNELISMTKAPLDLAHKSIMSSVNQRMQFDSAGLKLRKYVDKSQTQFDPKQMWLVNNGIVFTKDNWDSVSMAIGEIQDPISGAMTYGVCGPAMVGEVIAGNSLIIRTSTVHGNNIAEFIIDDAGARLRNACFDLVEDGVTGAGHISISPVYGLVGGRYGAISFVESDGTERGIVSGDEIITEISAIDLNNPPDVGFWLDMKGDAYFKGTVYADDGIFKGTVTASQIEGGTIDASVITAATINGTITAGSDGGAIEGVTLNIGKGKFTVDKDGNVVMDGGIKLGGDITWSTPPIMSMYAPTEDALDPEDPDNIQDNEWSPIMRSSDYWRKDSYDGGKTWCIPYQFRGKDGSSAKLPDFIEDTYISSVEIESPEITGNYIYAMRAFHIGDDDGYMGYAEGEDANGDTTYGVALANKATKGIIDTTSAGVNYVIVTDGGVRLQVNDTNLYLVDDSTNGTAVNIEVGGNIFKFDSQGIVINGQTMVAAP